MHEGFNTGNLQEVGTWGLHIFQIFYNVHILFYNINRLLEIMNTF